MKRLSRGTGLLPVVALLLAAWLGGRSTLDAHIEAVGTGVACHGVEGALDLAATHPVAPAHLEPSRTADREPPCRACDQERRGLGCRPLGSRPLAIAARGAEIATAPELVAASATAAPRRGRAPPSR